MEQVADIIKRKKLTRFVDREIPLWVGFCLFHATLGGLLASA